MVQIPCTRSFEIIERAFSKHFTLRLALSQAGARAEQVQLSVLEVPGKYLDDLDLEESMCHW